MKIRSLKICGFRGFSDETIFHFNDAKVILLYGPNGHGKTSVFDAIEWGLSGEIHRFDQATDERKRTRFIRNMHANPLKETYVEIDLIASNGLIFKVKRTCTARPQDMTDYGKHELELHLPVPINDRLKFMDADAESLLKTLLVKQAWTEKVEVSRGLHLTHILGQEKLNEFLRGMKDGDRYDSLSLLFGTEHFLKYKELYNELIKEINNRVHQIEGQITEGARKKAELKVFIDELSKKVFDPNQKLLSVALSEYKDNFSVPENLFEREDWNALIPLIEKETETLKQRRYDLENKERRIQDLEDIKSKWLTVLDELNMEVGRLGKLKNHRNDYNMHNLVSSLTNRNNQYEESLVFIKDKNIEIDSTKQAIEAIKGSVHISDNFIKVVTESLENLRNNKYDLIKDVQITHENFIWESKISELLNIISVNQSSIVDVSGIHASTSSSMKLLEESVLALHGIDKKYKNFLSSLSDYLSVEEEINSCPACGTEGVNKPQLQLRIQFEQAQIHNELPLLEQQIKEMKDKFEKEKTKLNELSLEIEKSYLDIKTILKSAEEECQNKKDHMLKMEKEIQNLSAQIELRNKFIHEYNEGLLRLGLNETIENKMGELLQLEQQFAANLMVLTAEEKADLPRKIKIAEDIILENQTFVESFISKLLLAGAPSEAKQWSVEEIKVFIQDALKNVQSEKEMVVHLESVIIKSITAIENAKEELLLKTRQEEMRVQQSHLEHLDQLKKTANEDQEAIKDLINNVKPAVDQLNEKMISELLDTIQRIFSRINSHPVYNHIDFNKEYRHKSYRLLILVLTGLENQTQANATYIFSSAQINSIALSFFMAMGLHQQWSSLQLMGMDDPIQSMDEVNVLSLIDLIRLFMEKYDKQFIISTHDYSFYQMMLKKFRNQDIAVIEYEGYSEKGPLIKQQVSENAEIENVLIIPAADPISRDKLLELNDASL
ncbi:exonuclease SbcC [Paenibacillus sp. PastF-3]|uniref:SMC family ATPase n=1 Tax=Paenibacillus sp. PastF-3 TaxID=2940626 RepID=UPI0024772B54|nr:SMC family ATPase [Paenibacillus sp. PastF-3]MDH6372515.1 exonuclease SbcC [Paenibacillus sp. PastF-3]